MAARTPLVLLGVTIAELKPGDSVSSVSKYMPVLVRAGAIVEVTLDNSPHILVGKRDGSNANVVLQV